MTQTSNEQFKEQCQKMIGLCDGFLRSSRRGFQQSANVSTLYPIVIYESEWCRVQFVWGGRDLYGGDAISIYYGRLHALDDKAIMTWKGEECYCWHRVNEALHFLDELSPQEAVDRFRVLSQWPLVMEQFRQSEIGKSLESNQPEWLIRMHANIWEHYGLRLFELFDLRRPDLWENFRHFLREFYEIKGLSSSITPPQYQRC